MTYGEAGAAREAIGSALRFHGLQKVSNFLDDLYLYFLGVIFSLKKTCAIVFTWASSI